MDSSIPQGWMPAEIFQKRAQINPVSPKYMYVIFLNIKEIKELGLKIVSVFSPFYMLYRLMIPYFEAYENT
jgi:hypothetical protein